jgi:hypothetical protein
LSHQVYFSLGMSAIITVFKSELENENEPELLNIISAMSSDMKEIANGYALSPKPGKLYESLNCLKENGLNYQTHFSEISSGE